MAIPGLPGGLVCQGNPSLFPLKGHLSQRGSRKIGLWGWFRLVIRFAEPFAIGGGHPFSGRWLGGFELGGSQPSGSLAFLDPVSV